MTSDHDGLRLTVDVATFAAWRAGSPGWAVPQEFDVTTADGTRPAPDSGAPVGGQVLPPFVAASLAVHAAADAAIRLRVDDGAVRVVACLSIAGGLVAVLVRAARAVPGSGFASGGWVQVGLVAATQAVPEVMSWVPEPDEIVHPDTGSMELLVVGADDAGSGELARWVVSGSRWQRLVPRPGGQVELLPAARADLASELTAAVVRVLAQRPREGGDPDGR